MVYGIQEEKSKVYSKHVKQRNVKAQSQTTHMGWVILNRFHTIPFYNTDKLYRQTWSLSASMICPSNQVIIRAHF